VILPSDTGGVDLAKDSTARDFVADAFAHCKFIGYNNAALPLFEKAGIVGEFDEGVILLSGPNDIPAFIKNLGKLRLWSREPNVKMK